MFETEIFYPTSQADWRQWLEKIISPSNLFGLFFMLNHQRSFPFLGVKQLMKHYALGGYTARRSKLTKKNHINFSANSKINKEKVHNLIEKGLMTQVGLNSIEVAKQNGSWTILD